MSNKPMGGCRIRMTWQPGWSAGYRTGVSLHSHTSHSRETLDFIPRFAGHFRPLALMLRRYEARYRRLHGRELDYQAAWWTPPLGPREALEVERGQLEREGLQPLVSITDHDNIEAPLLLRVLEGSRETPIGMEWTVPWNGAVFHLGLHGLPADSAISMAAEMNQYTSRPEELRLEALLAWAGQSPECLVVFNHPCWDEKGYGQAFHERRAEEFATRYGRRLHAVELNGLRPWAENRRALALAEATGLPAISGGDRHCCEPNATINLTNAGSYGEFAEEIRIGRRSTVAFMPQYREPLLRRILASIADVMRDNEAHTHGWTRWSDRVFFRRQCGRVEALSAVFTQGREPSLVRAFVAGARLLENRHLLAAMGGFQTREAELE